MATCGVENRYRDSDAFRYVVNRDCNGDRYTKAWVCQCGRKCRKAFRKIVYAYGKCCEHAHAHQFVFMMFTIAIHFFNGVHFMWVVYRRDQVVDQSDEAHTNKKTHCSDDAAHFNT